MLRDRNQFDDKFANQLRRMWFLGDVHGKFSHIAKYLKHAREKPGWLVFLGDIDINTAPFSSFLEPLAQSSPIDPAR